MHRIWTMLMLVALTLSLFSIGLQNTNAVKCEDETGTYKWDKEGHTDNTPSEKYFKKIANNPNTSPCELAKAIDHMKAEFEMSEKQFEKTFIKLPLWQNTTDDQKICMAERADLGNTFKEYEAQRCITGDY